MGNSTSSIRDAKTLCESKLQVQVKFKLKVREAASLVRELLLPRGRSLERKTMYHLCLRAVGTG